MANRCPLVALLLITACSSGYAVRPIPRIAADSVGQPIARLTDAFGTPRKVDASTTKLLYVWFLPQAPAGAPPGFHGCELEISVDPRSQTVLGYSLSNLGWSKCADMHRRIRRAAT
jgi:hypothetical protein